MKSIVVREIAEKGLVLHWRYGCRDWSQVVFLDEQFCSVLVLISEIFDARIRATEGRLDLVRHLLKGDVAWAEDDRDTVYCEGDVFIQLI